MTTTTLICAAVIIAAVALSYFTLGWQAAAMGIGIAAVIWLVFALTGRNERLPR